MLNSDWPIGPVGVRTLAAPEMVDEVGTKLDSIWWDRPVHGDRVWTSVPGRRPCTC